MPNISVCVYADCAEGRFSGFLQEWREAERQPFSSEQEFIEKINAYVTGGCAGNEWPESYEKWFDALHLRRKGGELFYWIDILYAQHHTWQGRLTCRAGKRRFVNQLELVALMKDAYKKVQGGKTGRSLA